MAMMAQLSADIAKTYPGAWNVNPATSMPIPLLATVNGYANRGNVVAGLYCWWNDFEVATYNMAPDMAYIGLKTIRIGMTAGGTMTDAQWNPISAYAHTTGARLSLMMQPLHTRNYYTPLNDVTQDNLFIAQAVAYVQAQLALFGPGGTKVDATHDPCYAIELWNEPNDETWFIGGFGLLDPTPTTNKNLVADLYARATHAVYQAVRANSAWNSVIVVGGSLSRDGIAEGTDGHIWLQRWLDAAAGYGWAATDMMDVLSNHTYTYECGPDTDLTPGFGYAWSAINATALERAELDAHGGSTIRIWWGEHGWSRPGGEGQFSTVGYHVTAHLQAAYSVRTFLMGMRCGIEAYHEMIDADGDGWNAGLINPYAGYPHTYYEAGEATKRYITLLPNPRIRSVINETGGYFAYELQPDVLVPAGTSIIVMWDIAGSSSRTITLAAGSYTMYDMLGGSDTLVSTGPTVVVPNVGPYPIFIDTLSGGGPPPGGGSKVMVRR